MPSPTAVCSDIVCPTLARLSKEALFFFVRINTNACTDHIPNVENSKLRIHLNVEMGAPKD